MKRLAAFAIGLLLLIAAATTYAAAVNTYQVTGPVLEVTSDTITVKKGNEKWQIARDASTKAPADIKVGTKVTVFYKMTATSIELPAAPKAKPAKKK